MIKVDENTIVEVGKFYLVKHAVVLSGYSDQFLYFVPTIGNIHKDLQFSGPYSHLHIDGRFVKKYDYYGVDSLGRTNHILRYGKDKVSGNLYFLETTYLKRKCIRTTTGINPPEKANKYFEWYNSMIGKSCAGKRCPHLGTTMHERDGVLVCPLHNLNGDMKTEKIIHQCQSGK